MKNTGMVRAIDKLGRIVLPMEMRKTMDMPVGSAVEMWVDGDSIMIKKYAPLFCSLCRDEAKLEILRAHGAVYCSRCGRRL